MSSERAGGLNRDWPGRAAALRSYGGELDQDMVDQLDRAHTPSERAGTPGDREAAAAYREGFRDGLAEMTGVTIERAGTPTRGALNREQAREVMREYDYENFANADQVLDALEECVVPDPRIDRIEALLDDTEAHVGDLTKDIWPNRTVHNPQVYVSQLRAIINEGLSK